MKHHKIDLKIKKMIYLYVKIQKKTKNFILKYRIGDAEYNNLHRL